MRKLIIKRLKINNFRKLKNITLNFTDYFNVIDGCNGIGKSSILDAIRYIFFYKNSEDKKPDNYKSINNDDLLPDIELIFEFDSKINNLKTKNSKWFINDVEFKTVNDYLKQLSKIFSIDNMDELYLRTNPHILIDLVTRNTNDKKEFKDQFISIINLGLNKENKIENFNEIVNKRNQFNEKIKEQKKKIKDIKEEIHHYTQSHNEIKCWDITNNNESINEISEIKRKIDLYEQIENLIKIKQNELNKLQIELNKSNEHFYPDSMNQNIKKESILKLIFLTIITFGLYWIFRKRKPRYSEFDNHVESMSNHQYEIKNINYKINELKTEIQKLYSDENYKNVDYAYLINRKLELKNENEDNVSINSYKLTYKQKNDNLIKQEQYLMQLESEFIKINHLYINSSKQIEEFIKQHFKEFDIFLFDNEGNDKFLISQDGVEIKYLNFANKNNIIHLLNEFIKKGIKISSFNLIDQAESFNNLYISDINVQTIACKVTDDKQIKLNGKNIN